MAEFRIEGKPVTGPYIRTALAQAYYKGWAVEWTGSYVEYLQTNVWREYRERIMRRDGHRCRLCADSENLVVHHSSYVFLGAERDQDVVTLCERCHIEFHARRKGLRKVDFLNVIREEAQRLEQDQLAHDEKCRKATEGQRALAGRETAQSSVSAQAELTTPSGRRERTSRPASVQDKALSAEGKPRKERLVGAAGGTAGEPSAASAREK